MLTNDSSSEKYAEDDLSTISEADQSDFDEDEVDGLKDKDYEEYFEEIQEQKQKDIKIMYGDEEGE